MPLPPGTLVFDIETHSAELLWAMPPEEFVRLIGYKHVGDKGVTLTTDLEEIREVILKAPGIVGHNIHSFDLPAVFGTDSNIPLELAMQCRVFDTWSHAALVHSPPRKYVNRHGKVRLAEKPEQMKSWFSLDEQAFQLGVQGKTHDLKELALEYGKKAYPDLPRAEQIRLGFGLIEVGDERYRDYLTGDVNASHEVADALLLRGKLNGYALREQELAARAFVITSNGMRVDVPKATARRDELARRKETILTELQDKYGLPREGKSPWRSKAGQAAILAALADHGITPESVGDWLKTKGGNLSLGGKELLRITEGTSAADLGQALAELLGQRSLAQLALDSTHPDGFVHPQITMLQRSGRWSTTEPGLTVWTNNGPGAIEKDYYLADNDDELLMEFDLSNADARIVAAYSGDRKYAERFEPGADGHMINAIAAWGEEVVATNPKGYRKKAKPLGHGWSYGAGPRGLQRASGLPYETCKEFCDGMAAEYAVLVEWQDAVRAEARRFGYVTNDWGRKMPVDPDRIYTQAPALLGQSGTREIIADILLKMPIDLLRRVKAQIHDALLMSLPAAHVDEYRARVLRLMHTVFKPKRGGLTMEFPADSGPAGRTWYEAIH